MADKTIACGRAALETLATRFPQLYVAPAKDAEEAHRRASGRGIPPEDASLDHFTSSDEDELREVETPAGSVEVLFLQARSDFETFLQIVGHRSQPVPIASSIGATTYLGLADWEKVRAAYSEYVASDGSDWSAEFSRLAKEPGAFRSQLIVVSEGPYSNIPAESTPYAPDEWLRVSREIRLHHECAHVVCRRLMPDDVLPIWDEITADVCGLMCATGAYDPSLAARFLGVEEQGFVGGRLEEYLTDDQRKRINEIARELYPVLARIQELSLNADDPFDFLLDLKRNPLVAY